MLNIDKQITFYLCGSFLNENIFSIVLFTIHTSIEHIKKINNYFFLFLNTYNFLTFTKVQWHVVQLINTIYPKSFGNGYFQNSNPYDLSFIYQELYAKHPNF